MTQFDPYLNWLGIPIHEQPPNFYRLLGVVLFESNPRVIEQAADRQSLVVGAYQTGVRADLCQRLLSEIAMARYSLLDPQQKASYDAYLQETLAARGERMVMSPPPPSSYAGSGYGPPPAHQAPPPGMLAMQPAMAMPTPPMPMQTRPQMMSAPPGYHPPAAIPVAAPVPPPVPVAAAFPVASRGAANATVAAKAVPPAAPPRPIDELESLASLPTTRRRRPVSKRKRKDYTKEIVIGSVIAGLALILVIVFIAVNSSNPKPSGFQGLSDEVKSPRGPSSPGAVVNKAKEEKKKSAADSNQTANSRKSQLAPMLDESTPRKNRKPANNATKAKGPEDGPSGLRSFGPDAGVAAPAAAAPDATQQAEQKIPPQEHDGIPPQIHDTPQDLGGDSDPVMELPKPGDTKQEEK